MSWISKTRGTIRLISPEYNIYTALWKGDERSGEKKIGRFDPPNFQGTISQDLNSKSSEYPITIYFEGLSHHTDAEKFFTSCEKEVGQWEVLHPVKGTKMLQLVSYKENIQPVESGNVTSFNLNFFEPANIDRVISTQESVLDTLMNAIDSIQDGINQAKQMRTDAYAAIQSAINMANKINGVCGVLEEIAATDEIIRDAWESTKTTYDSLVESFKNDAANPDVQAALFQVIIDIITIPLEANADYTVRFSTYIDVADSTFILAPETNTEESFNSVLMMELSIIGLLVAFCRIIVTSDFKTRSEIISAMNNLTLMFNNMIHSLEAVQEQFVDNDIDLKYFSQSTGYTGVVKLYTSALSYLTNQFYSAKSEKIIVLKRPRSPIEITITEYGENNFELNYDLFIKSNYLTGKEVLLLPAGKEVVIYA